MTKTAILDESAVSEIEAVNQMYRMDWRYPRQRERVAALCATVKHLRKRHEWLRSKIGHRDGAGPDVPVLQERYDKLIAQRNDLQSQLEQLRAENSRLQELLAAELAKRVNANVERMEQSQKVSQSEIKRTFDDRLTDTRRGSYE